jgi:hypothetical protein
LFAKEGNRGEAAKRMPTLRKQIFLRGLANRCPNCGGPLFERAFRLYHRCPKCGLEFERGEGFFLGSMAINYGVTVVVCLLPVLLLYVAGYLSGFAAPLLAGLGAVGFPILFYRSSRSWWLMAYFWFLPQELPANRRPLEPDEDEYV